MLRIKKFARLEIPLAIQILLFVASNTKGCLLKMSQTPFLYRNAYGLFVDRLCVLVVEKFLYLD